MGLTSGIFLAAAITAVAALPLATVLLWNRLRGPRAVRAAARFSLIGLCQGSAVLLAALLINNSFQLYLSWSDLLGEDGGPGRIQARMPVVQPAARPGSLPAGRALPNAGLFHAFAAVAGVQATTITGPLSRVTGSVYVWLPPQYTEARYAHSQFPVVQLLSGYPGSPVTWLQGMQAPRILDQEVTAGSVHPFILVAAAINVDPPHDPDCSDIAGGPQVDTWLTQDVHALVESSFRTRTDAHGWGLMGYSEGGLCASKLALQHSGEYAAAVSMSGDDHPDGDLLRAGTKAYEENSPLWLLQNRPPVPVALLLTGTMQDGATAAEADAMSTAAKNPTVVSRLIAPRGGHNVGVWTAAEPDGFQWLSQNLGGIETDPASSPMMLAPVAH
ncbi:MAG TPA: alpha/beta hydrolase-fold protein [Actinocrinis sp.]|nr:alpha/beta hydrolase-fold protein [Actinocrinis sp.]